MEKKRVFGELELAILQIFQNHQRLTVREVLSLLQADDKYTTIMTVMNRMVEKKLLMRERIGQQYEYWLNRSKNSQPSLLDQLKNKFFRGSSASMVSYLLESSDDFSKEEIEEMEKLIGELKKWKS